MRASRASALAQMVATGAIAILGGGTAAAVPVAAAAIRMIRPAGSVPNCDARMTNAGRSILPLDSRSWLTDACTSQSSLQALSRMASRTSSSCRASPGNPSQNPLMCYFVGSSA